MAYTPPNFNLTCDIWIAGNNPDEDPADFEGVACQLYLYSRGVWPIHPCELELYVPPIYLRFPVSVEAQWRAGQVFEVPVASGDYYRAKFKETMHSGFPNEYFVAVCVQCNGAGLPLLRDIENAVPCEAPDSIDGEGEEEMEFGVFAEGEGEVTSPPSDIEGGGSENMQFVAAVNGQGTIT